MPVYDRGYTHWEPSGRPSYPAWWVIARRGIVGETVGSCSGPPTHGYPIWSAA